MTIERSIVDLMRAALGVPVWFGAQPQESDNAPSIMPVVIVNRPEVGFINTFAGVDPDLALTTMQLDYYDETADGARRMSILGRQAMTQLADGLKPLCPTLDTEESFYDSMSRAWRVLQRWTVPDYAPADI